MLYAEHEAQLFGMYGRDYGGAEGMSYADELVKSFRETNAAWKQFRDAECWYESLRSGMNMSPDYAGAVAESCKLEQTRQRIQLLRRELSPPANRQPSAGG